MRQGIFIRGGTIIPKLQHEDCMAIIPCFMNPISLEIYLDEAMEAKGELYLDDGKSHKFRDGQSAHIKFEFKQNSLSTSHSGKQSEYKIPDSQKVT
jgi:alpha-glucosidase (family GH31 glycosyl hydrolase)